jgi:hypothetical protein
MAKAVEPVELDARVIQAGLEIKKVGARIQVVVLISNANGAGRQVDPIGSESV